VRSWVLLLYKVPPEPSAHRVHVWRKLKRLGAVLLHDAVWVLPASAATREQFQWLAAEISERGGSALVWEAALGPGQDGRETALIAQFTAQVDAAYQELLQELAQGDHQGDRDLAALARRYRQIQQQDYFHSELGALVRERLVAARERKGGGKP